MNPKKQPNCEIDEGPVTTDRSDTEPSDDELTPTASTISIPTPPPPPLPHLTAILVLPPKELFAQVNKSQTCYKLIMENIYQVVCAMSILLVGVVAFLEILSPLTPFNVGVPAGVVTFFSAGASCYVTKGDAPRDAYIKYCRFLGHSLKSALPLSSFWITTAVLHVLLLAQMTDFITNIKATKISYGLALLEGIVSLLIIFAVFWLIATDYINIRVRPAPRYPHNGRDVQLAARICINRQLGLRPQPYNTSSTRGGSYYSRSSTTTY